MLSNPERLAYWYFRLNGFLLLEDFVIHPDIGSDQRTDVDLLGVRFSNRAENLLRSMQDDLIVSDCQTFCNVIIAEVKKGECALNGPWTRPDDRNMHRILRAIGCFPRNKVDLVANDLYRAGRYQSKNVTCRLLAVGDKRGEIVIPGVPQILFTDMIRFIYRRFREYRDQKSSVGNWTEDGRILRELAESREETDFVMEVRGYFGLGNSS